MPISSDAPERIWAIEFSNSSNPRSWTDNKKIGALGCRTEYIREDIHRSQADRDRARIEALEGALMAVKDRLIGHGYTNKAPTLNLIDAALANTASDNGGQHGHE